MKKLLPLFLFIFTILLSVSSVNAQTFIDEDFEGTDSIPPAGWSVHNAASHYILPEWNWVVRDSGLNVPGLSSALSQSHNSLKSAGVSWLSGTDTNGAFLISDAWLVTKRITGLTAGTTLKFWATGGTTSWLDSMQVWASFIDSLPSNMVIYLNSYIWPAGSTYGNWTEYTLDLSTLAGVGDVWIGFRYYTDMAAAGFFVYLDDVLVQGPNSVQQISTNTPDRFALHQNYPNPFNPVSKIRYDIAKGTNVSLVVYNMMGQEVARLHEGYLSPGVYESTFDGNGLASGTYYYRIITDGFVETKKMLLVK